MNRRPMKIASAIILMLVCMTARAAEENSVHVGTVVKISKTELDLNQGEGYVSIGFVGDAGPLRAIKKIKRGDEVRAVFGTTRETPNGPLINKFLSIRVCRKNDHECAADRKRNDEASSERSKAFDVKAQERALCQKKMDEVLAKDVRYVQKTSSPVSREEMARYDALSGEQRVCAGAVSMRHLAAYSEACESSHCFDDVGGGCSHMTGYALHSSVVQKALEKCASPPD